MDNRLSFDSTNAALDCAADEIFINISCMKKDKIF